MKNLKIVVFLLISWFGCAQQLSNKELELAKPYFYKLNKNIFNTQVFESVADTNFVAPWLQKINSENAREFVDEITKNYKLQVIELSFENEKQQFIQLKVKFKNALNNHNQFKIEVVNYNLFDEKGIILELKNLVGLSQGGSNKMEFSENDINFYLKKNVEKTVSGKIKFKISALTSIKETLINKFPDQYLFTFKNSKYKIIEFGNNFIKFKGLDSLANSRIKNLKFLNLNKKLNQINRKLNALDFSNTQFNDNSSFKQNTSYSSNQVSLPQIFFDEKVSKMNFQEYSKFFDENINSKLKNEIIHYIKFETKIDKLYFYEDFFDEAIEIEINLNKQIKIIQISEK